MNEFMLCKCGTNILYGHAVWVDGKPEMCTQCAGKEIERLKEENRLIECAFFESETIHADGSLRGSIVEMQKTIEKQSKEVEQLKAELSRVTLQLNNEIQEMTDEPFDIIKDGCGYAWVGCPVKSMENIIEQLKAKVKYQDETIDIQISKNNAKDKMLEHLSSENKRLSDLWKFGEVE